MKYSSRIEKLPPYLFAHFDPNNKTAMAKASNHQYPFGAGLVAFRKAIAAFMDKRFKVRLDPASEIYSLIGSKEGLGHLPLAFIDPGQVALVPDPAYPVYKNATLFAGGEPYLMPLKEERDFLPDFGAIPKAVLQRARLLCLNYPNNPVAAVAPRVFLEEVVQFAKRNNLIVAYDNAYSEMYFEEVPLSFLEIPGAKDVGIEFHSLSKTYNMTGWRIAWVCGNAELIKGLAQIKDSVDSGAFQAIQEAAIATLNSPASCVDDMRDLYRKRRDLFVQLMRNAGWELASPKATFYIWAHTPQGFTSTETAARLLDEVGVVCTPGVGFGPSGEGYVRFALTVEEKRLRQAVERIAQVKWNK